MIRRLPFASFLVPLLAPALLVSLPGDSAAADRARNPADATVFVRLVGNVHVERDRYGLTQTDDLEQVEIGTGSGFVISPYGYVLTNDHVVRDSERVVTSATGKTKISLKVSRIEVCFPPDAPAARELPSACLPASIYASDPALDLAVLFISAANLPYLALGDSDAVSAGQPIDALGFPFGRELEVAQAMTAPDLVPQITTTPGAISATRSSEGGERRYLQITSSVNPGNSGGPVVDRDGFAVGVIRMKIVGAAGIGFAIPINQVKDFLELHGLDHLMPARRMRLGPFQAVEGKGVGLRLPEGLTDTSLFRSRVETDPKSADVVLRIDRVLSPWNPKRIEQVLVGGESFERVSVASSESHVSSRAGNPQLLTGRATGTTADNSQEIRIEYAILDLGGEKLVARYIGPAAQMALNASVLRDSLTGLEGQRIVAGDLDPIDKLQWTAASMTDGRSRVPLPAGWLVEPAGPSPCTRLPPASAVVAAFPTHDFAVSVRAAVWSAADFAPEQAASACSPRRGPLGPTSYASRMEWLGVSYSLEGTFTRVGDRQVIQLEVVAPDQKSALTRALLASWVTVVP